MIHREDHPLEGPPHRDGDVVAVLRMEHGKVNAIDLDLFEDLDRVFDDVQADDKVRALVLTGTGSAFSAGVNLFKVAEGAEYLSAFLPHLTASVRRLFTLPLPVVAAVNGHALAGGFILVEACDYRLMAEGRGKVGLTEMAVGVAFPVGALEVMRFQAPGRLFQDLILNARTMSGPEAAELGLIDEIVPSEELLARAVAQAVKAAAIPRQTFSLTKEQLRAPAVERMDVGAPVYDPRVLEVWNHPECQGRIRQFLEQTVGKRS